MNDEESENDESFSDETEDETLTDNEIKDFEAVNDRHLEQNEYKDCGGCSKILEISNSYKCKKCGIVSHRSNCNTWFDHLKKHYFCGGCAHDFKYKKYGEISESEMSHF